MGNYHTGGTSNETAPDIRPIIEATLGLSSSELAAPCWQQLQEELKRRLSFYRADNIDEGTPTEQRRLVEKYVNDLKDMEEILCSSSLLPYDFTIGEFELKRGLPPDVNDIIYYYILRKRLAAEDSLEANKDYKGKSGAPKQHAKTKLLTWLAQEIRNNAPKAGKIKIRLAAAKILNAPDAFGETHKQFANGRIDAQGYGLISEDPKQLRKLLPDI